MRGFFFLSVLTLVSARPGSNPFLSPAPISAVQPIVNDSAEFTALFNYAPKAPPAIPCADKTETTQERHTKARKRNSYATTLSVDATIEQAVCTGLTASNPTTFWRELINHNGASPFNNDSTYQTWRDVKAYGAKGDGVTDDSAAFQFAIDAWSRNSTYQQSTVPAYVYVPAGTYLIGSSIQMLVNTMLVGDPLHVPTLKAASTLGNNTIIQGFDQSRNLSSTMNFYIGLRNLVLDTTAIDTSTEAVALNWPVSQACTLSNVHFNMPNYSSHVGVDMNGGGSGTIISDLSFTGGAIGIRLNNQQYAFKSLTFNGCHTAIAISHVFTLSAQDITFMNCGTGIDMSSNGVAGSVTLLDSSADFVGTVVSAYSTGYGEGSLIVENFESTNSGPTVTAANGTITLVSGSVSNTWVMGNTNPGNYQSGTYYTTMRSPALLAATGKYFTKPIPQYEEYDISQFVNVKDHGVKGDGSTDDTAAINAILLANAGCKITYFPQGVYLVYDTVYVPPGSRIVGEAWSVISAKGSSFADASNPHVMVRVGNPGEVGVAQFTDMLFTTADVLNGAILLEVNMAAATAGDVGFWNTHFRVGGAVDSLVNSNCGGPNADDCKATFLMLHVTPTGSPYIENMWGWTADHSLDTNFNQVISTGRGALIQGTRGTWLVGTAFEHATLYQYNLASAQNVFIAMQQTETAYWEGPGSPISAPTPWAVNTAYSDPDFSACARDDQQCRMAWAMRISGGSEIFIYGSGFWVFFNGLTFADGQGYGTSDACEASCCQKNVCQRNAAEVVGDPMGLWWYAVNTHLMTNLVVDGSNVVSQDNNTGSWGGVVAAFLAHSY